MAAKVQRVEKHADDVIVVYGTVEGIEGTVRATGWASAMENHYPDSAYDSEGALKLKAVKPSGDALGDPVTKPRKMTKLEKLRYCKQLLIEQNPQPPEKLPIQG